MSNPNINELGKETRFTSERQPDHCGRPKGSKSLKTMLVELLSSQDPDGEWAKSVAGQLIRKAFKDGNMQALEQIIDRLEGKVPQKLEGGGSFGDTKIVIVRDKEQVGTKAESVSRPLSV